MTDIELNKRIHEIMGYCPHNNISQIWNECTDCHRLSLRMDFIASWEGFGIAWEFMQKHARREEFLHYCMAQVYSSWDCLPSGDYSGMVLPVPIISPRPFAEAMCEFFKEGINV